MVTAVWNRACTTFSSHFENILITYPWGSWCLNTTYNRAPDLAALLLPFLPLIKQRLKGLQELLLWKSCFPQVSLAMTQGRWILWEYLTQWTWMFRFQQPNEMFKYVSELWGFLLDTLPAILAFHSFPPPFQPNLLVFFFFFFLLFLSISPMCLLTHLTHLRLQSDLPFFHIPVAFHCYFDHSNHKNLKILLWFFTV